MARPQVRLTDDAYIALTTLKRLTGVPQRYGASQIIEKELKARFHGMGRTYPEGLPIDKKEKALPGQDL